MGTDLKWVHILNGYRSLMGTDL